MERFSIWIPRYLRRGSSFCLLGICLSHPAGAESLFTIDKIVDWKKEPDTHHKGIYYGVYEESKAGGTQAMRFVPSVEAQARAREESKGADLIAKAYFYDETRRLVATVERPAPAYFNTHRSYGMADLFPKNRPLSLFFPVPSVLQGKKWNIVVVFGNSREAATRVFPANTPLSSFDFPERRLALFGGGAAMVQQSAATPGTIEYVAKTRSKLQPQITMFFKLPSGVKNMAELKGLIGTVVIASRVDDAREKFLRLGQDPTPGTIDELAARYKLGILCWGAHTLWNKTENTAALSMEQQRAEDAEFDLVAEGWEKGVDDMAKKYGIPNRNILLTGVSQAGQWVHRLALRKPGRILAVHAHVSSTYGLPTAEGAQTLWLITTGEQDAGYENSLDFYDACRKLGYPFIIKAQPGLGHGESPSLRKLEYCFFEYALTLAARRHPGNNTMPTPWTSQNLEGFRKPEFWGDILSQKVVPAANMNSIEPDDRVPLPTREIADAWNRSPVTRSISAQAR